MSDKILSIVIPAYNVQSTLKKTVESIMDANKDHKIEILIINDGSQDGTASLSQELKKKYGNDILICNKENGGHGSVINKGIELATGKYFKVIDGDDWVDAEQLLLLIDFMENCSADLVVNNYSMIVDKTYEKLSYIEFNKKVPIRETVEFDKYCNETDYYSIHAFSIKTDILKNNNIKVSENVFYEDTQFILYPIPYVNTIAYSNYNVYMYRVASGTQSINPKNLIKNRKHRVIVLEGLLKYYDKIGYLMSESKKQYYIKRVLDQIIGQYNLFCSFDNYGENLKSEINELKELICSHNDIWWSCLGKLGFIKRLNSENLSVSRLEYYFRRIIHRGKAGRLIDKVDKARIRRTIRKVKR